MPNEPRLSIIGADGFQGGGGCMSAGDISDISGITPMFQLNMKRRGFHELQPRNPENPV